LPRTSLQCCYIFVSFDIIDDSSFKCWEFSTAQAGARGVRDVALFHYPSCTDSNNRICNHHAILLFLMLQMDHFLLDIYFSSLKVSIYACEDNLAWYSIVLNIYMVTYLHINASWAHVNDNDFVTLLANYCYANGQTGDIFK
jgi:hypothetical protein